MSLQKLKELVSGSKYIVFFGGAGVSTESNIPDFRSENGIYNAKAQYGHTPEEMLSHSFFMSHPEEFFNFYRKNMIFRHARPNQAHYALAELEKKRNLKAVVTQNIGMVT